MLPYPSTLPRWNLCLMFLKLINRNRWKRTVVCTAFPDDTEALTDQQATCKLKLWNIVRKTYEITKSKENSNSTRIPVSKQEAQKNNPNYVCLEITVIGCTCKCHKFSCDLRWPGESCQCKFPTWLPCGLYTFIYTLNDFEINIMDFKIL